MDSASMAFNSAGVFCRRSFPAQQARPTVSDSASFGRVDLLLEECPGAWRAPKPINGVFEARRALSAGNVRQLHGTCLPVTASARSIPGPTGETAWYALHLDTYHQVVVSGQSDSPR
jgi:hypothetical protein